MADPNANNPRRSEKNRNAPGPSAPRFQAAGPSQPQNQQSSGARQLAGQKRGSEVLDPDPANGRKLTTTEDQVQNRVGRGRLAGAIDLSQRLAQNLSVPRQNEVTGYFSGVYVMEDQLRPIWIRQEGDRAREIMVSVTPLRPGFRLQTQLGEHVGSPDNARLGLEFPEPARITAMPPPVAEENDEENERDGDEYTGKTPPPRMSLTSNLPLAPLRFPRLLARTASDRITSYHAAQTEFHLDYSHFHFLVESRAGLPAIRSDKWNWVDLAVQFQNRRLVAYPLTRAFSLRLTKEDIAAQVIDQGGQTELLRVDPLTCSYEALLQNKERLCKTEFGRSVRE
ncbi:hypothetical protein Daesc_004846 [Daldinia eschscholtzii]|uniref:Uncharacterized protein n=1 Tax=Daldinia eschscholtzii TaxID=292717 RepID=A0AAX6MQU4_9PEZI